MNAAERASFGPAIGHVMEVLEEATGVERIYMTALCAHLSLPLHALPFRVRTSK